MGRIGVQHEELGCDRTPTLRRRNSMHVAIPVCLSDLPGERPAQQFSGGCSGARICVGRGRVRVLFGT